MHLLDTGRLPPMHLLHFSHVAALASEAAIGTGRVSCSFCRSVCPLVTTVNSGKTDDSIEMHFKVVDRVGQRNHVL